MADSGTEARMPQGNFTRSIFNQWKSLPNLWLSHQNCADSLREKRYLYRNRADTLVPSTLTEGIERSKSMDFAGQCVELNPYVDGDHREVDVSSFDLYLSKDFTDFMNTSFSERSDVDSMEAKLELEESLDNWTELRSSDLTQSNLTQSLASRMYSYENLDRVGKNLYKINKWFQRCSFDESDDAKEETGHFKST